MFDFLRWYDIVLSVNLNPLNWRFPKWSNEGGGIYILYFGPLTVIIAR